MRKHPASEVATVIIVAGTPKAKKILLRFNSKWGSFSPPTTKPRKWRDQTSGKYVQESFQEAAIRAAAEAIGRTVLSDEIEEVKPNEFVPDSWNMLAPFFDFSQDEVGILKEYRFYVFKISLDRIPKINSDMAMEWLSPAECRDPSRKPISTVVTRVLKYAGF